MARALVSIGVSKAFVGDGVGAMLPPLPGALEDAHRMADWARAQQYEHVHAFVDDHGPVEGAPIYQCVDALVKKKELERLIIFFAGHGYSPAGGGEMLLLSRWEDNGNEAINLSASVRNAQRWESPQISIIADACRTTFTTATPPTGMLILPSPGRGARPANVDRFFATHFGDPAQEVKAGGAQKNYGIFSKELFRALNGKAADALIDREGRRVLTSQSLELHLDRSVPDACGAVPGAIIQYPETIAEWKQPYDEYAVFPANNVAIEARGVEAVERNFAPRPRVVAANAERAAVLERRAAEIGSAEGRATFETKTGVSVLGAEIADVYSRAHAEPFAEAGAWHVRMPDTAPEIVLIQIEHAQWSKYWLAVAVFPGLIATVKVDERGFSSLNYHRGDRAQEAYEQRVQEDMANATAHLESGHKLTPERVRDLTIAFRNLKGQNPALGILAAYLCDSAGRWDDIRDMSNYGIGGGNYTPYDLLLLTGGDLPASRRMVGAFPLFARGWSLLASAETNVPIQAHEARRYVAPSLWTMVTPEGGASLRNLLALEQSAWLATRLE